MNSKWLTALFWWYLFIFLKLNLPLKNSHLKSGIPSPWAISFHPLLFLRSVLTISSLFLLPNTINFVYLTNSLLYFIRLLNSVVLSSVSFKFFSEGSRIDRLVLLRLCSAFTNSFCLWYLLWADYYLNLKLWNSWEWSFCLIKASSLGGGGGSIFLLTKTLESNG